LGTLKKAVTSGSAFIAIIQRVNRLFISNQPSNDYPENTGRWLDLFIIRRIISKRIGPYSGKINYYDHHLTHQLYGCMVKGWDDCIILSYDGGGESDSTVVSVLSDGNIKPIKRVKWPNSLGHFYSFFTGYLGFRMLEGEYKMMGLAPYGKPVFHDLILNKILDLCSDGDYRLNTRLCDYHRALRGDFPDDLVQLFGLPRRSTDPLTEAHINLAASVQSAFEAAQMHILHWAKKRYPEVDRLVVSGGCALNVTANGQILRAGIYSEIAVPPAPHDAGCAVGAVLASLSSSDLSTAELRHSVANPYLGSSYSNDEIAQAFHAFSLPTPPIVSDDELINIVTESLCNRGVVAWFQGRSEFGPRALGSRSFLADPRDDSIREDINKKIKKRELFRPFAPSITEEECSNFFEIHQASPYMNIVANVLPDKRGVIPAVTHIDGTARVHTVNREVNPIYHRLITAFGEKTGIPVLLNTSLNIQEPIVYTPRDVIRTFMQSDVDMLAIGNFVCDAKWRKDMNLSYVES
jgi:carbamoyltransferase